MKVHQTSLNLVSSCQWCGSTHTGMCPTVKAIEYHPDGTMKRVEFKTAADYPPLEMGPSPFWQAPNIALSTITPSPMEREK